MERILTEWRKWKEGQSVAGLSTKDRARKKHSEESSKAIRRSMGAGEELVAGEDDLNRLSRGIYEEELLQDENPFHHPKTGRLSTGAVKDIYSLSRKATDKAGIDPKYAKKGEVGKSKDKDGKRKLKHKYGLHRCGRRPVVGPDHTPTISCSNFNKLYKEDQAPELDEDQAVVDREYLRGMMKMNIDAAMKEIRALLQQSGGRGKGCSLDNIIRIINQFELSQKGKAFERPKE